jgi:ABC-2 type transport system permease protein/sodium transport system permease protein
VALFIGLPLAAAIVQRVQVKDGFQLRSTGPLAFVAAVVLGLAMWPPAYEVYLLNKLIGLTAVGDQHVQLVERLLKQCRDMSPLVILLTMAVIPAVCEELFFRGYLFRALIRASSAFSAIWLSAVLFGVFHAVATSMLAIERFLPSTFLGLMLGWVCWRTGSVLPGILLHVCHNGLLLMIAYYGDELAARGWGIDERTHLPASWLAAATVGIALGVAIIVLTGSKADPNQLPSHNS